MVIPYRIRRILKRLGTVLLIFLVVFLLVWVSWVVWLERYVIYSRDGASVNFDLSLELPEGVIAAPPSADSEIEIYFNEGDNSIETSNDLTQLNGYFIDTDTLDTDAAGALAIVESLPTGTAVMIDLKSIKGAFYYPSELPDATYANVDMSVMNTLIDTVVDGNYYAIARIPAFCDYYYGLNHVDCGLSHSGWGKGYLWKDDNGCYWLDPTSSTSLNWVLSIVLELKAMGFDEVVLDDFRFPETDKILFSGDQDAAITSAMETFMTNCISNSFCLSFVSTRAATQMPDSRCRLYLEDISASNVETVAAKATITNPQIRLVFIATSNDTRYNSYGVLRSIDAATVLEN